MERFILNNPVNSGEAQTSGVVGNPERSLLHGNVQRLFREEVGLSEPKCRRPGKGLWFDGEVCVMCGNTDYPHHAKSLCKKCYRYLWYLKNPGAKAVHDSSYYRRNRIAIINRVLDYYKVNGDYIKERTRIWYRNRQYDGNMVLALERDNYTCRNIYCSLDCDRLDVHHLDGRGVNHSEPNYELENLLTLCASCHGRVSMGHEIVWTALKDVAVYDPTQIVVIVDGYRSSDLY